MVNLVGVFSPPADEIPWITAPALASALGTIVTLVNFPSIAAPS